VRYGLALPTGGECGDPRFLLELAVAAEQNGWEGVFLEDYVFYQGDPARPTCNTWAALAAIAVRTTRIVLGVEVVALTRRRPWNVAREAAAVDQLSEGRLVLGVGIGDQGDPGYTHFGEETNTRVRAGILDEGLQIVAGLWTGEPFSFRGRHFEIEEVTWQSAAGRGEGTSTRSSSIAVRSRRPAQTGGSSGFRPRSESRCEKQSCGGHCGSIESARLAGPPGAQHLSRRAAPRSLRRRGEVCPAER
jgi:Luciferase-like monooxygenase